MFQSRRHLASIVGVTALALLVSTGCVVGKKAWRKNIEETNTRIQGVESGVEQNERRISDVATDTDKKIGTVRQTAEKAVEVGNNALQQAETAQKMARGKMLWEVTLSDDRVRFGFDQSKVPPDAATVLDDLAQKVKSMDKAVYLEIEGHTDNIGSADFNQKLGEARAEAVRDYLAEKGLPLHSMNVISYGEDRPVADNKSKDGRAQNRRVVVRVLE